MKSWLATLIATAALTVVLSIAYTWMVLPLVAMALYVGFKIDKSDV